MVNLDYAKHFKRNTKYKTHRLLRSQNIKALKETIKLKVNQIVKDSGREYIQINIFNSKAIKDNQKIDIHNCWIEDKTIIDDNEIEIAILLIYISEANKPAPTEEQWLTMFGFTSKEHEWNPTDKNIYMDLNGITLTEYNPEKAGIVFIPDKENEPVKSPNKSL